LVILFPDSSLNRISDGSIRYRPSQSVVNDVSSVIETINAIFSVAPDHSPSISSSRVDLNFEPLIGSDSAPRRLSNDFVIPFGYTSSSNTFISLMNSLG
jgi:hypothetical protein